MRGWLRGGRGSGGRVGGGRGRVDSPSLESGEVEIGSGEGRTMQNWPSQTRSK